MPRFRRDRDDVEVRVVAPGLFEVQEALEADYVLALPQAAQLSAELWAPEQTRFAVRVPEHEHASS